MRLLTPISLVALAAGLAGCAQRTASVSGFKGVEKTVAQVVVDLGDDASRGRESDVCSKILSPRLQKSVAGGSSCISEVKKAFEDADSDRIDVDDVTITGATATAKVHTTSRGSTARRTFKLVRVNGDWRIDSFG